MSLHLNTYMSPGSSSPRPDHQLVLVHDHRFAVLVQHLSIERDHAAVGPLPFRAKDLFFHVDVSPIKVGFVNRRRSIP